MFIKKIFTKKTLSLSILIVGALGLIILGNNIVKAITEGGAGNTNEITIPQDLAVTRFIADSNSATGTVDQVLTAKAGGVEWSDASSGGQTLYDFTVCASGCDYTSIYTAFNSNSTTPSSYWVSKGTYSETVNVVVPSTSSIHFEQATIDFSTNSAYFDASTANNTTINGNLILQGDGGTSNAQLWYSAGSGNDYSSLTTQIVLESAGTNSTLPVRISGSNNDVGHIIVRDITLAGTGPVIMIWPLEVTRTKGNFTVKNINISTSGQLNGIRFQTNSIYNVFNVLVEDVVNATAAEKGIELDAGSNYNSIFGVVYNVATNLDDNATGNNTAALVI